MTEVKEEEAEEVVMDVVVTEEVVDEGLGITPNIERDIMQGMIMKTILNIDKATILHHA
jgi:hypothetical protein